jgi:hypothetical protein
MVDRGSPRKVSKFGYEGRSHLFLVVTKSSTVGFGFGIAEANLVLNAFLVVSNLRWD